MSHEYRPGDRDWFDYDKQAWVKDGLWVRCSHPTPCDCYGRAHEGEKAPVPSHGINPKQPAWS